MVKPIQISVVIPVYNMGEFLPQLVGSLVRSGMMDLATEVILVDDGSTDDTPQIAQDLSKQDSRVRLLRLEENRGRYIARLRGAQAATTKHILFIDARIELAPDFATQLQQYWRDSDFLQPQARIDVSRNLFCLYWDRSHRAIFRRHFKDMAAGPIDLTPQNYEQYLKGTTAVLMPKVLFLNACHAMGPTALLSDDTALMRRMVETQPLRLAPNLWYWWVPRETLSAFLWRLYDRGPGLVEYHVFQQRGWIFKAIVLGSMLLALWLSLLVAEPKVAFGALISTIILMALSARWLAQNWKEGLKLAPLHVAVLFAVGLGVLKGLAVNTVRWIKGEIKWAP
ncbi:MAG: glycosyltransferase family 2 protein [Bdellovibrionales bacterium]